MSFGSTIVVIYKIFLSGTSYKENSGNTNERCGEPVDMSAKPSHVFRCEIYGQHINLKKTNKPVLYTLAIHEIIVNVEPTSEYRNKIFCVILKENILIAIYDVLQRMQYSYVPEFYTINIGL